MGKQPSRDTQSHVSCVGSLQHLKMRRCEVIKERLHNCVKGEVSALSPSFFSLCYRYFSDLSDWCSKFILPESHSNKSVTICLKMCRGGKTQHMLHRDLMIHSLLLHPVTTEAVANERILDTTHASVQ